MVDAESFTRLIQMHNRRVLMKHQKKSVGIEGIPSFAPDLVRRHPEIFLDEYNRAFSDGLHGRKRQSVSPLYLLWFREGSMMRRLHLGLSRPKPIS
jgi:hypothetical protein